jgi:predicted RNA-binding Zn ribbon-like protein
MQVLATDRLRLPAGRAPGGLSLVQELVNTALRPKRSGPSRIADLLADEDQANRWLDAALAHWSARTGQDAPALRLAAADLAPLRRLRESVRALASVDAAAGGADRAAVESGGDSVDGSGGGSGGGSFPPAGVSVALRLDGEGRVRYGTAATGWRGVATLVTAEILLAQHTATWRRFKTCPFPPCGVAFYDESRNNSRVWDDVRACGNRVNLAASRERRRAG